MTKASVLAKEKAAEKVALAEVEGVIPEAKLESVSKDGEVVLKLSKDIEFPASLLKTVNSSNRPAKKDRRMNDD